MKIFAISLMLFLSLLASPGQVVSQELKADIQAFDLDKPHAFSLGGFVPVESNAVQRTVGRGALAIPYLIQGLKSDSPMIAAQCALCLDMLKAKRAAPAIRESLKRLDFDESTDTKNSRRYAFERMSVYLSHYDDNWK